MKKELDYFKIEGGYGGNQSWFRDIPMKMGGCAAVAACDACICLARQRDEAGLYPFDYREVSREEFLCFADRMKVYLRPRLGGISRLDIFVKGMNRYLKKIGESRIRLEAFGGCHGAGEAGRMLMDRIDQGYPVPYLNLLHKNPEFRNYQWHWFMLAGYDRRQDRLLVKAVTYGGVRWLDFDSLWETGYRHKGGMILMQDGKREGGLSSPWGRDLDPNHILEEYPRPGLVREHWTNLNGVWHGRIESEGGGEIYEGEILVPFSPESRLSGVGHILQPGETLTYSRSFVLPQSQPVGENRELLLHFGAVDQECRVYVNGQPVGEHRGGYLAFSCNITHAVTGGNNEIRVVVRDRTEYGPHARGKQKLVKKGRYSALFYTPQSGIWKSVWMEEVPACGIESLRWTAHVDKGRVDLLVKSRKAADRGGDKALVTISYAGEVLVDTWAETDEVTALNLPQVHLWSPETPHLYDVRVTYGEDQVTSYFAMRCFTIEPDGKGIPRFCLNHKPIFFHGVLDQGYWPESLMTPPSDQALCHDIRKLKAWGYNTIRKHIKVESERFYYHCDRLGMMVWQDMPNGGGDYSMLFVTYLPNIFRWFGRLVRDSHYKWFRREDPRGRDWYYEDLSGMIDQLHHHPSIAAWVLFNEGWGQFDAGRASGLVRGLDSGRFINEACGWFDQGGGDMYTIHNYLWKLKMPRREKRVVALTEYGGYALAVRGHMDMEKMPEGKSFGYGTYESSQDLSRAYGRLLEREVFPHLKEGLSAAIYTQTNDIETEMNGLMTYDREVDKFDTRALTEWNERLLRLYEEAIQ